MKVTLHRTHIGSRSSGRAERGSTLIMVLVLATASLLVLGSVLAWTNTNTALSQRNNEYNRSVLVAEAATEKVISSIDADYTRAGEPQVLATSSIDGYRSMVPTSTEDPLFANYLITDAQGNQNKTYVQYVPPSEFRVLSAQYRGLHGYATAFKVISNAKERSSRFNITAAVKQEIEAVTIPLFQFAIFYNLDLEINPGPNMTVTGPVHSNGTNYLQPQATLTFESDVTAAGAIILNKKPNDPLSRTPGSVVFEAEHDGGVSTLNLPIGTNNSPAAVHQVVEVPPSGESASSQLGQQRLYNKAKILVTVTDSAVTVKNGPAVSTSVSVPQAQWDYFLNVGTTFYNKREGKSVSAVEIDVGNLKTWMNTNSTLLGTKTSDAQNIPNVMYVDDQRTLNSSTERGVRVLDGRELPTGGLTVVTADPVYVWGDYNTKDASGTSSGNNTSHTKPAALMGDAITILSNDWLDSHGSMALSSRIASDTTVNAAFLAGIVETTASSYSGGVENFPRFLEDWNNRTFTYNGSIVVMFPSQIARGLWQGTGSSIGIYNPPLRDWAFDLNFRVPAKLPPGTPAVRALIRGSWAMVKPNSTS